jgi:uncharacterized protein (TIGR02145 family)
MGTATILGDTYSTVIMPDGKEWLAENCKYSGLGVWWNSGVSNDGDGRYYSFSDIQALNALLADGWRVPTYADTSAMILASRDVASNHCWSSCLPVEWPNAGRCTNANGFSATPSGYFRDYGGPSWVYKDTVFYSWNHINIDYGYGLGYGVIEINEDSAGDVGFSAGVGAPTNDFLSSRFPVRLVREAGIQGIYPAQGGVWRHANEVHVAQGGAWRKANRVFIADAGAWREVT